MGFTVEYDITREGWDGQITHSFSERYKSRKAATQAVDRIEKEYAKSEITRLEMIADNEREKY